MRRTAAIVLAALTWLVPAMADPSDADWQAKVKATEETNSCDAFYPANSEQTGTTYMVVHVEKSGRIHGAQIVRSSGDYDLDKAAFRCADYLHIVEPRRILTPLEFDWLAGIVWAGHGRAYLIIPNPKTGKGNDCGGVVPPPAVREARLSGTTEIRFHINLEGAVEDSVVSQSSGQPELDALSMICVSRFTYMPARHNDQRIMLEWMAVLSWDFR